MIVKQNSLKDLAELVSSKGDPYKILEEQLGSSVAEYRRKWKLAGRGELQLQYPLHLNIELVYGCNLKCEFCAFSGSLDDPKHQVRRGKRISFEKYCEIIDEGVKRGLCSVSLNGYNEPLIQQDIAEYIKYARQAGVIDVSLHTNALLLTEQISRGLIDSDLSMIMFSIDGFTKQTYEKVRQGSSYDTVMQNVLRFLELKKQSGRVLPLTRVSFVKNKVNIEELNDFVHFWDGKIDFIILQSFGNPFVYHEGYDQMEQIYRLDDNPFENCFQPYRRLSIASNGNVLPCCSYYGLENVVGSIYNNSIYDIWNNSQMKTLRKTVNQDMPLACKKCRMSVVSKDYAISNMAMQQESV